MTQDIGIDHLWSFVRTHFKTLFIVGLLSSVVGFVAATAAPKTYRASASILPPTNTEFLPLLPASEAAWAFPFLPRWGYISFIELYTGILASDRVVGRVYDQFELQERYGASTRVRGLKRLRGNTIVDPDETGIIHVSVEDKDPSEAAAMANAYVEFLDDALKQQRRRTGAAARSFLEGRLALTEARLDSLAQKFSDLQKEAGIPAISDGATEAAMAAGELLGQRLDLEIQLEVMDMMGSRSSPHYQETRLQLQAVEKEIVELPPIAQEMGRVLRDVYLYRYVHQNLFRKLEEQKVKEVRETPIAQVLDVAYPPDRHVRPRRGLSTAAGGVGGVWLAVLVLALRRRPSRESEP